MTQKTSRERMLELLEGDGAFLDELCRVGIVPSGELTPDQVERVLVARTLVQELEVNLPGVEVILRLRAQLMETRAQYVSLARKLEDKTEPNDS